MHPHAHMKADLELLKAELAAVRGELADLRRATAPSPEQLARVDAALAAQKQEAAYEEAKQRAQVRIDAESLRRAAEQKAKEQAQHEYTYGSKANPLPAGAHWRDFSGVLRSRDGVRIDVLEQEAMSHLFRGRARKEVKLAVPEH